MSENDNYNIINKKSNKNLKIIIILLIILIIVFAIVFSDNFIKEKESNEDGINVESTEIKVEYSDKDFGEEKESYNAKIILDDTKTTIQGNGVTNSENKIIIKSAGTYYVTGSISDGSIEIEVNKDDEVSLILAGASITSEQTVPINCTKADKLIITLEKDTINILNDNSEIKTDENGDNEEPDGAIFTKSDLTINGEGKLIVNTSSSDGIVSKDGLKIVNTNIEISSGDDGIRGKDYVAINNSNITINSKEDGIKSTNNTDTSLGYIVIENADISINAGTDGIQAETILNVSNSKINIITTGNIQSSSAFSNMNQNFRYEQMENSKLNTNSQENSVSSKGLKAGSEITIQSGIIEITSTDDSIHSNGTIIINNGTFTLSSEDDGIHADSSIVINDGDIDILKSYEGIESAYIEINGGKIKLKASDDGINVAGGNDSSSTNGRPGQNSFGNVADTNRKLVINDGEIDVDADGDGLDANGSIYIKGRKNFS